MLTALRLGAVGLPPRPPAEEATPHGHRHSRDRDAHHYDLSSDFYRLLLGESMTHSCAYWPDQNASCDDEASDAPPGSSLTAAQTAKFDLVADKLGLAPGMRLLDVGCGWGSFAVHADRRHGTRVVGVTLSREQAR